MSNEFIRQAHTHVLFDGVLDDHGTCPCFEIMHHTGEFVWVKGSYMNDLRDLDEIKPVGDGRSNGYDQDGDLILSVPIRHIKCYMTEDEFEGLAQMVDADKTLLGYAR